MRVVAPSEVSREMVRMTLLSASEVEGGLDDGDWLVAPDGIDEGAPAAAGRPESGMSVLVA